MQFPFTVIQSITTTRSEFHVTDGHQPTHALFYLKSGSFEIRTNGTSQRISKGECYILPDFVYYHRKVIEPIEFLYVKFTVNEKCPYTMEIPFGKVTVLDHDRFLSSITALEQIIAADSTLCRGYREHLLLDILFQIHFEGHPEGISDENQNCADPLVNAAISYINENLTQKILIDQICHHIGTNPSTLNFKFRRELNCSVGQYLIDQRLKKARKLLLGTSYPVGEIARRCGFENVYCFSNTFKKKLGLSPSEYRK